MSPCLIYRARLLVVVTLCFFAGAQAYPSGAPVAACKTMNPQHSQPVLDLAGSPYSISVDKQTVEPGGKVTVTITATAGSPFKGILLQGRPSGANTPVGVWGIPSADYQHLDCSGAQAALTHTNNTQKPLVTTFIWTAPSPANSNHVIYATIVKETQTVYLKQSSPTIFVGTPTTASTTTMTMSASATTSNQTTTPNNGMMTSMSSMASSAPSGSSTATPASSGTPTAGANNNTPLTTTTSTSGAAELVGAWWQMFALSLCQLVLARLA